MNFMNIIPKPQKITFSGKYVPHGSVNESVDADMGKEEYSLKINRDGVFLKGGSERALHYADITYKQILREDGNMLPECEIRDKPVFSYRGFMVDVCRHFFTVEEIKKIIDAAAMLKFNYFHFHLSDDQGFRAEIKKHPELSLVGGSREGSHFGHELHHGEKQPHDQRHELQQVDEHRVAQQHHLPQVGDALQSRRTEEIQQHITDKTEREKHGDQIVPARFQPLLIKNST